jgi:hypothetical protein
VAYQRADQVRGVRSEYGDVKKGGVAVGHLSKRLGVSVGLFASLVLLALFSGAQLQAQSIYGTITGTVIDPSGGAVANANVTLKNTASGDVRRTVSNSDGYYSFSSVPAGAYSLTVEAAGFQKSVTEGISVNGAASLSYPIKLALGAATEQVTVEAIGDQIIPTDSGEKSTVLTEKQLQDFTIVSNNAAEFIKILPGFAPRNNSDGLKSGTDYTGEVIGINGNGDGGSQSPLNGAFVANGTGVNNIDITADGAHVSDPGCNCATPVNPNADMIQEFKVLTSNFSAENSKGPIVINSIAKAGGHDFHGLVAFSARDYALNANRWVNNFTGTAKPKNKFFYPEGQIGGPVLFPHTNFNRNRDKLFFFTGFEYFYQTLDTGLLGATVPTEGMRNGDFSPTELAKLGVKTASGGAPSQLNPCLTVNPTPATGCGTAASPMSWMDGLIQTQAGGAAPIPGGVFPASLINPSGQGMLGAGVLPLPNADPNLTNGYNYVQDVDFNQNSWQWLSRVDYSISDNTKLYIRYNLQKETQQFPIGLWWRNAQQVPYPTPILGKNRSDSVSASLTHVFSPTLSNEFVFGYTYIDFPNVFGDPQKVSRAALNIPFQGLFHNGVDQIPSMTGWGGEFPSMFNPGGFEAGGSAGLFAKKHLPSVSDNVSKVWGTHTAKFGFFYEFVINNQPNNTYSNGLFVQAGWAGGSSGNPYADLLAGFAGQYQETNFSNLHNEGYNTAEFFAMDSWRVTRRLTVDYGLRFSHLGAWYDRQGFGFAVFDPGLYDGTVGSGFDYHKQTSAVPLSGFPNRALYYAPRFGMAYDLFGTGRTVLRGGWGQYRYHNAQFTQGLDQPVGVETTTVNSLNFANIEAATQNGGVTLPFSTGAVSPNDDESPLTTSYSFSISQRIPFSSLLEVSYVGNQSKYGLNQNGVGTNVNTVPFGTLFGLPNPNVGSGEYLYAPYPIYQTISVANHNIESNYNALQVSLVRAKGNFDMAFNYTYSKSLGTLNAGCCNALDQLNPKNDYGAQPFDRRHLFNAAYSIELPKPIHDNRALEGIINGWQVSGITSVQSGVNLSANSTNLNFNAAGNISGLTTVDGFNISSQSINGTDQIALMPILTCDPRQNLGPHQYLNGDCFAIPTEPGKNGPTVLPEFFGPWFWTSDLSLFKNFHIKESQKLQFRFSAYNFMNHPLWSFSGSGVGANNLYLNFGSDGGGGQRQTNANFGVTPIKVGNRIIQFAIKYYF